jgi:hypothetical protein
MSRRVYPFALALYAAVTLYACGGGGGSPTPPTITISGFPDSGKTQTLGAAASYALSAKETGSGGGAVTPGPLTITLSSAALGTVSGSTFVTGVVNASGTVKVEDSTTKLSETFTVTVLTTLPATVGNTVTLTGSLVHTVARPLPAPSAIESPSTTTAKVTDVLTIPSTTATFGAKTGLVDEHVVESDVAPLQTLTTTSDTYAGFVTASAIREFFEDGVTSTDSNGVVDSTTFGAGAGLIDELPDVNGATWASTAAETFSETEPDGTAIARTVASGGTYSETDTYLGQPPPETIATNSDLSASITGFADFNVDVTYAKPSGAGAGATIAYTVDVPGSPALASGTIADWYPTTTIFSDTFAKATSQTIPAACAVSAKVGTTAVEVTETSHRLDTALGTYEKRTQSVFDAPGFGSVCVQLADEIDTYYDYTGQSANVLVPGLNFAIGSTPIQIDTLAETLGFSTGTVSGSSVSRTPASLSPASVVRAVSPLFDRAVAAVYRSRRDAERRYVTLHRAALGKVLRR